MKKHVAIVAGGDPFHLPQLSNYPLIDTWIGCDYGAYLLVEAGLPVDIAIGDFDSVTPAQLAVIKKEAASVQAFPVEKDKSDLELAIDVVQTLNVASLTLFGVTGGRLDHELSNIFLMERLKKAGLPIAIIDEHHQIDLFLPGVHVIKDDKVFQNYSFLALSDTVEGVTLENAYYPLTDATITRGDSLTLSNKKVKDDLILTFRQGVLLVIRTDLT